MTERDELHVASLSTVLEDVASLLRGLPANVTAIGPAARNAL